MSTQKGNIKKEGQKHQNTFGFKHNKNSRLTRKIQETPLDYLCEKCLLVLEWKIKFRKYKPLTTPSKCKKCDGKNVYKAHREVCDKCCHDLKICSKCIEPCEEYANPTKSSKILRNRPKDNTFDEIIELLKERQRRTVLRRMENGEDIIFDGEKGIINKNTQEVIIDINNINSGALDDFIDDEDVGKNGDNVNSGKEKEKKIEENEEEDEEGEDEEEEEEEM